MQKQEMTDNRQKKTLHLFTASFPYGKGEAFVENELIFLAEKFQHIEIYPFYFAGIKHRRDVPGNCHVNKPLLFDSKPRRIAAGLLNVSPVLPFVREFFNKRVFLNRKHFKEWFQTMVDTRFLLQTEYFKTIESREDELLYFFWGHRYAYIVPFLKKKHQTVVRFHGADLYEYRSNGYIPLRTDLFLNISKAVFISDDGRRYFENTYPDIQVERHVFRLGTRDHGLSNESSDGIFRIYSCAYNVPVKRIYLIAEALQRIQNIRIHWTHIGDGDKCQRLETALQTMPDNITMDFKGNLPNEEVLKLFGEVPADLFLNVSSSEGLPVSTMEAISFGIPVMGTDVGGTKEIISKQTGVLLPADPTADVLSREITDFIENGQIDRRDVRAFWEGNFSASANYPVFVEFLQTTLDSPKMSGSAE